MIKEGYTDTCSAKAYIKMNTSTPETVQKAIESDSTIPAKVDIVILTYE
jgi:hypothetical protein